MILDAELSYARSQTVAIGFALVLHEIRMGRAEYHIDGVRADFDDSRHGVDHRLDALAGRQETERQDDLLANEAQFCLGVTRFEKRAVGYSVWNDVDLASWHGMTRAEQFVALFRHDNQFRRRIDDPSQDVALGWRRLLQHRMKCRDNRHFEVGQEI